MLPTARAPSRSRNGAKTELRATGARPRRIVLTGLDSLTASELRIAELACQGLTNREIAQTLFVTARTVEGHLTSVFRKLLVDSRDKLPAALADGAPVPAFTFPADPALLPAESFRTGDARIIHPDRATPALSRSAARP